MASGINVDNIFNRFIAEKEIKQDGSFPDIISFVKADWGLKFKLLPFQEFTLKLYYNLPLNDYDKTIKLRNYPEEKVVYEFTEKELAVFLYEEKRLSKNPDFTPDLPYQELVMLLGRRGTKTALTSIICAYEIAKMVVHPNIQKKYGLPENEEIRVSNVASKKEQADILYRALQNQINKPFFDKYRYYQKDQTSIIRLYTERDLEVKSEGRPVLPSIFASAATCSAAGLRGPGSIVIALDEIAHFKTNDGNQSDTAIYTAIGPSMSAFNVKNEKYIKVNEGKAVLLTSPLGEYGVAYERFKDAFEDQRSGGTISFRMPSWWTNDTIPMSYLKGEERKDPSSFYSEYGADLIGGKGTFINRIEKLNACIKADKKYKTRGLPGIRYYAALDAAFSNDGFAMAIVHIEGQMGILDTLYHWKAGEGLYATCEFLDPKVIVQEIYKVYRSFRIEASVCDQWAGTIGLLSDLANLGVGNIIRETYTTNINSDISKKFLSELYFGNLELPYDQDFKDELLSLRKDTVANHNIKVEAPPGKHDDRYDAASRAFYLAFDKENPLKHKAVAKHVILGRRSGISANPTNSQRLANMRRNTPY